MKTVNYDKTIFKGLTKLSPYKRKQLYEYIINLDINNNLLQDEVNQYLTQEINFQRNLKIVRGR